MKHLHKVHPDQMVEYARILSALSPSQNLGKRTAKNIFEMEYGQVEYMRQNIHTSEGAIRSISMVFDCSEEVVMDYRLVQFNKALAHITKQLSYIETLEQNNLSKPPKKELKDAGIHRLNRFGSLNTVKELAKEFSCSPLEVEKWPYTTVYHLAWMRKIESDIQDDYVEITKTKK